MEQSSNESESKVSCESKAGDLIPETLILKDNPMGSFNLHNNQWKDGTEIDGLAIYFVRGKKEGQNTDYLYTGDNSRSLTYSKQIISREDGTILGINRFSIRPVLKKRILGSAQEHDIIEPNIVECNWVTD